MAVVKRSAIEAGEDFLAHYGIKGMKWGVNRSTAKLAGSVVTAGVKRAYSPSKDAMNAAQYQTIAKFGGVRSLNNSEMRQVIQRMELEQRYRDLYGEHQLHDEAVSRAKRWAKKGARWAGRFTENVAQDAATSWVSRPGGSISSGKAPVRVKSYISEPAHSIAGTERKAIGR